jgi:hypothetical protein
VENITAIAFLFKHQNGAFAIIHETNAMIDLVAEYVEKITKASWETPLNVAQRPQVKRRSIHR